MRAQCKDDKASLANYLFNLDGRNFSRRLFDHPNDIHFKMRFTGLTRYQGIVSLKT